MDVKRNIVITVSSDKGLCGGINTTSVKVSKAINRMNSGIYDLLIAILLKTKLTVHWY